jgi:hypothetical protein
MNIHKINDSIYITSDEEIEEDMWFLPISGIGWKLNIPIKADENGGYHNEHCKKIILTTDQNLINDGVQPIDDEFLEWFVKNPDCKYVDVYLKGQTIRGYHTVPKEQISSIYLKHQIIIPKEEPKQEISDGESQVFDTENLTVPIDARDEAFEILRHNIMIAPVDREYRIKLLTSLSNYIDTLKP